MNFVINSINGVSQALYRIYQSQYGENEIWHFCDKKVRKVMERCVSKKINPYPQTRHRVIAWSCAPLYYSHWCTWAYNCWGLNVGINMDSLMFDMTIRTDIFRMNLDMVKRENSVITLDDDFNPETAGFDPRNPESYIFMTMMQSAYLEQSIQFAQDIMNQLSSGPLVRNRGVSQDPFYVLWKTSMPSVLVELGFISNKNDLAALLSEEKTGQIADALLAENVLDMRHTVDAGDETAQFGC